MRTEPRAATSATAEPEISAKNSEVPDLHHRKPAAHEPDQGGRQGDQPSGNPAGVHDRSGQDEQGHRDQGEFHGAVKQGQWDVGDVAEAGFEGHGADRCKPQCDRDGNVDENQGEQPHQNPKQGHAAPSQVSMATVSSATMNSTAPTGIAEYTTAAGSHGKLTRNTPPEYCQQFQAHPGSEPEEADDCGLAQQRQRQSHSSRSPLNDVRHAEVGSVQGREGRTVICQPGQKDRRYFVVPDKGVTGLPAEDADHDKQGQRSSDCHDRTLQEARQNGP